MPFPGSVDNLTLTVNPYDGTTAVTVVVEKPGGSTLTPTAITADGGHTWVASPTYDATGRWVATWTITGTGAGVIPEEVWVSAIPSAAALVAWRPDPWHVAAYVPRRTLVGASDGYGTAVRTFTADTNPPVDDVWRLITDACAWVSVLVGAVDSTLTDAARACAAMAAAAAVEGGYPDNRDDLSNAEQLLARATAMRADLDRANAAVTGTDPEDPGSQLLPIYSFEAAPAWASYYL